MDCRCFVVLFPFSSFRFSRKGRRKRHFWRAGGCADYNFPCGNYVLLVGNFAHCRKGRCGRRRTKAAVTRNMPPFPENKAKEKNNDEYYRKPFRHGQCRHACGDFRNGGHGQGERKRRVSKSRNGAVCRHEHRQPTVFPDNRYQYPYFLWREKSLFDSAAYMDKLIICAYFGAFRPFFPDKTEVKKIKYLLPILICLVIIIAVKNRAPVYQLFLEGAEDGLKILFSILPAMIAVLSMAEMLKASGALSAFTAFLSPFSEKLGIPSEILPLALLRPFSGGGSLGLLTDTVKTYGADSQIARAACILCASTETTFYTISVYFRKTSVKNTKAVIFAAIIGDFVGILCACWLSKINF